MSKRRVLIMGAAGRDFHNFNVYFRERDDYEVVAFTATQIPNITGRLYPPSLAGNLYPDGIPIHGETELEELIKREKIDEVVFAYSDIPHIEVMHKASRAIAAGADFILLGARSTWIPSNKPVISVCATRTGSGKSQTTRKIGEVLQSMGKTFAIIRHPMPYGDLAAQAVQRFATYDDLAKHNCTIEEREEYEPHIARGWIVYAGVDYGAILKQAEAESDVILWDGGNNDLPFYRPDLNIVVADPHRPEHQTTSHPGEANLRMAGYVVVNKVDTAAKEDVETVVRLIKKVNPGAVIIMADSPVTVKEPELINGRRVLVVEDGPTLTHGNMGYGAGIVAAEKYGAAECIDPRPFAVGDIKATLEKFKQIGNLIPAMGYGEKQVRDLEATINASGADAVLNGSPADIARLVKVNVPIVRVTYELKEIGTPNMETIVKDLLEKRG